MKNIGFLFIGSGKGSGRGSGGALSARRIEHLLKPIEQSVCSLFYLFFACLPPSKIIDFLSLFCAFHCFAFFMFFGQNFLHASDWGGVEGGGGEGGEIKASKQH